VSRLRVLSLGAGVQSSALLLMSCRGELPKLDYAIFSDTQYEPTAVYSHLEWLKEEAAKADIPLITVTAGDIRKDAIEFRQHRKSSDGKRFASIPLFVLNGDGSQGRIRRQCTSEYKIIPVETYIKRTILGLKPGQRAPRHVVVEQWMGITRDEAHRASTPYSKKRKGKDGETIKSPILWKTHAFPLMNLTLWHDGTRPQGGNFDGPELNWKRSDCVTWLEATYPDRVTPRSACICCPYRSNAEWRDMKENRPDEWADAVEFDRQIRDADIKGQSMRKLLVGAPFVHRQLVPLSEADLRSDNQKFGSLFGEECEGMCGV
jgi:hypothetical protein